MKEQRDKARASDWIGDESEEKIWADLRSKKLLGISRL